MLLRISLLGMALLRMSLLRITGLGVAGLRISLLRIPGLLGLPGLRLLVRVDRLLLLWTGAVRILHLLVAPSERLGIADCSGGGTPVVRVSVAPWCGAVAPALVGHASPWTTWRPVSPSGRDGTSPPTSEPTRLGRVVMRNVTLRQSAPDAAVGQIITYAAVSAREPRG